jgi:hypothetical protein
MNVDVLDLRSGFAMELKILRQEAAQAMLVKDDDAIHIFAADRADDGAATTFLMPAARTCWERQDSTAMLAASTVRFPRIARDSWYR